MPTTHNIAVALLTRREYTQHELAEKLKAKHCADSEITITINDLIQAGYLNDQRSAESFTHSRRNRGYGPVRVKQALRERGINDETIAEVLQITDNAWFAAARTLWQKRFKGKLPSEYKDRAKQTRFLLYRGFMREHIESIFKPIDED